MNHLNSIDIDVDRQNTNHLNSLKAAQERADERILKVQEDKQEYIRLYETYGDDGGFLESLAEFQWREEVIKKGVEAEKQKAIEFARLHAATLFANALALAETPQVSINTPRVTRQ